ncbi:hypothetical protein SAMN03159363_1418 [Variovorax sp. EL159]|nr:hypothetical protein SAMN03159363_1418 [Variovorax sp. EL159]
MSDSRSVLRRGARLLCWTLCLATALLGAKYCLDAWGRAHAGEHPYRWQIDTATVQGVSYTAKSAFVRGDTLVLRLYRTGDPTLLAERMFTEHGVELHWTEDGWLIYDTSDTSYEEGSIRLPPTRLDNFLARLP